MLLRILFDSAGLILTRPFRSILLKSLLLTLSLLGCLYFGLVGFLDWLIDFELGQFSLIVSLLTGVGSLVAVFILAAPVASLFVGLYVDDVAQVVERERFPHDRIGKNQSFTSGFLRAIGFTMVILIVNTLALFLFFVFGLGFFVFVIANAYLLSREFFDLAALRYVEPSTSKQLKQKHRVVIFLAGLCLALLLLVPILNILVPLFGTIVFVQLFKSLSKGRAPAPRPAQAVL